jgi:glycosyltransferase involved in cell wall biosynthesis
MGSWSETAMRAGSRPLRVALIRGSALNPFDAQQYGAGGDGVEMVAVGTRRPAYPLDLVEMPVRSLPAGTDYLPAIVTRRLGRRQTATFSPDALIGLRPGVRGCDVLHVAETHIVTSAQAAMLRRRSARRRLVVTAWENIPFLHEDDGPLSERKRLVRETADAFVAVTAQAREALIAEGVRPERIEVRPAAVDASRFAPGRRRDHAFAPHGVPDGCRVVLFVGRLIPEKGVVDLILALAEQSSDTHLVCVGSGGERPRLVTAARSLGVEQRVHFTGDVGYDEIGSLMASCDVLAVPSLPTPYWSEQFGMVLAEGMSCGAPIVAYDSGAVAEVVGDAAILCRAYARDELANRLSDLLQDGRLAASLRARAVERASRCYDASDSKRWWPAYYKRVAGR